ncbi:MAG TPA: redoxin domain-containing protein [Longimicrobiales bacterium]
MRLAGLAVSLILFVTGCGVAEGGSRPDQARPGAADPAAARPAPPLEGTELGGSRFRLSEHRGEIVVLVFNRGPYCGICRERLRALTSNASRYEALDARVFAVVHGPEDAWADIVDENDVEVPVVVVDRRTLERWGVWPRGATAPRPAAFVVDRRGRIRFRHVGATAADRVGDVVLLAATREVREPPTAAVAR